MAAAPVVTKLKNRPPFDPEPQAPPIDGGKHIPPGDRTPAQTKKPGKRTPPKNKIPAYKRPSPGGNKPLPSPTPKKKPRATGLATYASQIK